MPSWGVSLCVKDIYITSTCECLGDAISCLLFS